MKAKLKDLNASNLSAGLVSALVGLMASVAIVWEAVGHVGGTPAMAASGILTGTLAMAILSVWAAFRTAMPVSIVWTMPGLAFVLASPVPAGGASDLVGAFMMTGLAITAVGLWPWLARLTAAIPSVLASAMLAGVLLPLCLSPFQALMTEPWMAGAMLAAYVIGARVHPLLALPSALAATALALLLTSDAVWSTNITALAQPVWVAPSISLASMVGLALPLFVITMAAQNIPGFAILGSFGFRPEPRPVYLGTGLASVIIAPLLGPTLNLAAITAALVAGPDAGADPAKRYWAAAIAGLGYPVLGIFAGVLVALIAIIPPEIVRALAGLALLGAFTGSLRAAFEDEKHRQTAMIVFLVAASGVSFAGIGAAFWALVGGSALWLWDERRARV